jgi:hypothetical protein
MELLTQAFLKMDNSSRGNICRKIRKKYTRENLKIINSKEKANRRRRASIHITVSLRITSNLEKAKSFSIVETSSRESLSMANSKARALLNHLLINTKGSLRMESIMARENTHGSQVIFMMETTKKVKNADMEFTLA